MNQDKKTNNTQDHHSLSVYLARAGVSSRRKAVDLIKEGLVAINGHKVSEPWHQVGPKVTVTVRGKRVIAEPSVYLVMNKPRGCITTCDDDQGRPTVLARIGSSVPQRVYPVGRLDADTTGVLVCTNDGDLAHRLAHPKFEVRKIYCVQLNKPLSLEHQARIRAGVYLRDGFVKVDRLRLIGRGQKTRVIEITLHSGRNRVIRRLCEALGYQVCRLDRTRYGLLTTRGINVGAYRHLKPNEVEALSTQDASEKKTVRRTKHTSIKRGGQKTTGRKEHYIEKKTTRRTKQTAIGRTKKTVTRRVKKDTGKVHRKKSVERKERRRR